MCYTGYNKDEEGAAYEWKTKPHYGRLRLGRWRCEKKDAVEGEDGKPMKE
jgi:hypothetical protein